MKAIPLTKGKVALVSDKDYWLVRQLKWWARRGHNKIWYACAWNPAGRPKIIRMHRLIAGFPPFDLDHKNRNGLDNQRQNLRPATASQNHGNMARPKSNTSGKKGVTRLPFGRWRARIQNRHIGAYATAAQAQTAYVEEAGKVFGVFARAA